MWYSNFGLFSFPCSMAYAYLLNLSLQHFWYHHTEFCFIPILWIWSGFQYWQFTIKWEVCQFFFCSIIDIYSWLLCFKATLSVLLGYVAFSYEKYDQFQPEILHSILGQLLLLFSITLQLVNMSIGWNHLLIAKLMFTFISLM